MTKEQTIKHLKLMQSGVRNAIRFSKNDKNISEEEKKEDKEIYQDQLEALDMAIKALEQPTTQEILSHIETGITATGPSDSYCVGFCNALIWLKACITHEEPQFFEDGKVSENSTGSTTFDDCVSRQAVSDKAELIELEDGQTFYCISPEDVKALPSVKPTRKSGLHWIERFDDTDKWLECPHCHKDSDNAYAYCPNCGASFKEEKRGSENGSN